MERRKERILYMNTVREQGPSSREGAMAQLLLLSKVPPIRPVRLALALLRKETAEIPARFFRGDMEGAVMLQLKLLQLMNQLMIETNPIPAKAACAALGYGKNILRLPLVEMEENNRQKLFALMREAGLEVVE